MNKKIYHKNLNIIRLISCIAVLLYHLGYLRGGYLAVCTFFVLSGYLSCVSAFNKEKFSLISYYKNKFLKIYLPLIVVVLLTTIAIPYFKDIIWLNQKPETTSALLGYNNFWQLNTNLDYFTKQVNSPFIHLWYISILIQFEIIFPFIYLILRKLGDHTKKYIPCIIMFILSLVGIIYFYYSSTTNTIMFIYYNTFTRIFSLLFGVTIGFIHSYYKPFTPFKNKIVNTSLFYIDLILLILQFIFIDSSSKYFVLFMILTTLETCRLISYGTLNSKEKLNVFDKIIKFFSDQSYAIYLCQYPVIYLMQYINGNNNYKLALTIVLILLISFIIHFGLIAKKEGKLKILKYIILIILLSLSIYGGYQYYLCKDHTIEMQELAHQLEENQLIIQKSQEEYISKLKQEEDSWKETLNDLENSEEQIRNKIASLPIIGIGDSIMLGAVQNLYGQFPNGYFDAKVSRSAWVVKGIIKDLKSRNMLGNPIIFNLGANGDCSESCKIEIMNELTDKEVFWVTVTNDKDVYFNNKIKNFANRYNNLHIIDWETISKGHNNYFVADGIHLTTPGRIAYTQAIYNAIYPIYLQEFNAKKEEILKKHEEELKTKLCFFGNDIITTNFNSLKQDYQDSKFTINKDFTYETLIESINNSIKDNTLSYKIFFAFDKTLELTIDQLTNIINICKDHKIYILSSNKTTIDNLNTINNKDIEIINFYQEILNHEDYLMADKQHLTDIGNNTLKNIINDTLKQKELDN